MEVPSAFNSGVQGFQRAQLSANEAAQNIVKQTTPPENEQAERSAESQRAEAQEQTSLASNQQTPTLTDSIVQLKVAEHQAKASANVIKTADETIGTLIDTKA